MRTCIFCHKDSSNSKSDHFFAIKIENELLSQPYFVSMRFRNEILTKKGKLVRQKMIFPGAMKSTDIVMQTTENGIIASFNDDELYEAIKAGKTSKMIAPYIPEPEYPNAIMSRFLAKCAYEYFLYNMGKDNYDSCIQDFLGRGKDLLKELREYARYGVGKYWQYNQRRIYSEGDYYYNQNENICYEILHEMKLFVKEHKRFQNGNVEAEIYFVMAIAGIEYAISLSDPDISEYQKWIEGNKGLSPLKDDAEKLSFSMSDVNLMLIKKDDYRIH